MQPGISTRANGLRPDVASPQKTQASVAPFLDNAGLKALLAKKMVTPAAKREAVAHVRSAFELRERRACTDDGAVLFAPATGHRVARAAEGTRP
jgi:hypothetical protein